MYAEQDTKLRIEIQDQKEEFKMMKEQQKTRN